MASRWEIFFVCLLYLSAAVQLPAKTHVFILAGQSNMLGKGTYDELPDTLKQHPDNVLFYNAGKLENFTTLRRFGPEIGFAHAIADLWPDDTIMLVKFAVRSTSIYCWHPSFSAESTSITNNDCDTLFTRLLGYVTSVTQNRDVDFAGMLWMQGERDAKYPRAGNNYLKNLHTLADSIRTWISNPRLPFILGRIVAPTYPARDTVRWAQRTVQDTREMVKMVNTDDLGFLGDNLHYNTSGQVKLGQRFATAFIELTQMTDSREKQRINNSRMSRVIHGNLVQKGIVSLKPEICVTSNRIYSLSGRCITSSEIAGGYRLIYNSSISSNKCNEFNK